MTTPATGLLFLSWLRTGMLASLDASASAPGSLDVLPAANARPTIKVDATAASGQFTAVLHGPGEVQGIDPAQVVRREPPDGAADVEVSFLPMVEFDRPDLPWLASPAHAHPGTPTGTDPRNGLLPWLCLVVVEDAAATVNAAATPLPRVTVPLVQLPDPAQAWLWAHAQVLVGAGETVQTVLDSAPDRTLSRLIAPRRLRPHTRYLAAVVPLFESGRQAGFGTPSGSAALSYAWTPPPAGSTATIELPTYLHWRFSTGEGGDFRSLAAKLQPTKTGQAGVRPLDIGSAGSGLPRPGPSDPAWTIPFEGPITGSAVVHGAWPAVPARATYQAALASRLVGQPGELAPPLYGSAALGSKPLDSAGLDAAPPWLRQLNLDPRYRVLAALGTAVVQRNAEALVASAWQQAGQLRRVNERLRRAQLAREIGRSLYEQRIGKPGAAVLSNDRLLQVTNPVHDQVVTATTSALAAGTSPAGASPAGVAAAAPPTVADQLAVSAPAAAATSVAFRRLTRPTGPLARRALAAGTSTLAAGSTLAAAPTTRPLLIPVTALGSGQLKPLPPVRPVPGVTSFDQLSGSAVTWGAITPQVVQAAVYPWEPGAPQSIPATIAAAAGTTPAVTAPAVAAPAVAGEASTEQAGSEDADTAEVIHTEAIDTEAIDTEDAAGTEETELVDRLAAVARQLATAERAALAEVRQSATVLPPPPGRVPGPYGYGADLIVNDKLGVGLNFDGQPTQGWTANPLPSSWSTHYNWSWKYSDLLGVNGVARLEIGFNSTGLGTRAFGGVFWQPGYLTALGAELPPVSLPFELGSNVPWSSVVITDIAGTGKPAIVLIWNSGDYGSTLTARTTYYSVGLGLTSTSLPTKWTLPTAIRSSYLSWPMSVTAAGGLIYLLDLTGRLTVVTLDATGALIGQHLSMTSWQTTMPRGYKTGAIVAADFGGSFGTDLLHVMATDGGAAMRLVYDVGADGSIGGISETTPLPIDIKAGYVTASIGASSLVSEQRRASATATFRTAAAATQARQARINGLPTQPAAPQVVLDQAAAAVRSQLDPASTVVQATTERLTIDVTVSGGTDPLQPLVATPVYRVASYDLLREQFAQYVVPGASLPDNSVTALVGNSAAIEAFLVGMNAELSRELLWRQYPSQHGNTYFRRFWNRRSATGAPVNEISPIENWSATSQLGSHGDAAVDNLLLVVRGELLRRMPSTIVYAAPAVLDTQPLHPDLSHRVDPLFVGHLDPDLTVFGFPMTAAAALGNNDNDHGWFFVFGEHPTAVRFGLHEPPYPGLFGGKPATWRELDWNQALGSPWVSHLDAGPRAPLAATMLTDEGSGTQHRWGFSSAHMAHILLRPPTQVAVHASSLVQLS
jgi:hypothetical protein